MKTELNWTRINSDVNGKPRFVTHFLNLIPDSEGLELSEKYDVAVKRANKIGGRRFHNKQYGGGIVFQSYNLQDTEDSIARIVERESARI